MLIQIASGNIIDHDVILGPFLLPYFQILQRGGQLCSSPSDKPKQWAIFKALRLREAFGALYAKVFQVWEDVNMPTSGGAPLLPLLIMPHSHFLIKPAIPTWNGSQ